MRIQSSQLYGESNEPRLSKGLLLDLNFPRYGRYHRNLERCLSFLQANRVAIIISTLSLLCIWQWHVAQLATQRADMAERDMQLNAQQAIQLSKAVINAQESRDDLQRLNGVTLPTAK